MRVGPHFGQNFNSKPLLSVTLISRFCIINDVIFLAANISSQPSLHVFVAFLKYVDVHKFQSILHPGHIPQLFDSNVTQRAVLFSQHAKLWYFLGVCAFGVDRSDAGRIDCKIFDPAVHPG